jgi:hypothetical protein
MAQSQLTVTTPSPTPPTNMSFTGSTPPNVPNYTKNTYNDPKNWSYVNPKDFPPPYFDDGAAGPLHTFAASTAALASGTGATSGGTENSYPGTDTAPIDTVNAIGPVPASTSVAHEGAGTEVTVLAPGNVTHTYVVGTLDMSRSASCGPTLTATIADVTKIISPNNLHASSDTAAPTAAPTITGLLPVAPVGNGGTAVLTVNGTNFRNGAVVNIAGVPYNTQYNSPTQLMVLNAPKRTSAGNTAITVRVGATTTAGTNWVFS